MTKDFHSQASQSKQETIRAFVTRIYGGKADSFSAAGHWKLPIMEGDKAPTNYGSNTLRIGIFQKQIMWAEKTA